MRLAGVLLLGHIAGSFELTEVLAAGELIRAHALYPLVLILILLGVFTLIRRHDAPAPALPASAPATPTAVSPATQVATPETAPALLQRKPAVVRDRQARPLAGNPAPAYPPAALRAGIEGSVVASLQVDAQGTVWIGGQVQCVIDGSIHW